jgi:hypothetical protein
LASLWRQFSANERNLWRQFSKWKNEIRSSEQGPFLFVYLRAGEYFLILFRLLRV